MDRISFEDAPPVRLYEFNVMALRRRNHPSQTRGDGIQVHLVGVSLPAYSVIIRLIKLTIRMEKQVRLWFVNRPSS